ncbi:MAG: Omp28-related outer membrane protein [Chlorobi bacterium]|nr:Omp28-related outer membrane protein [Chlorobiota bacterium]
MKKFLFLLSLVIMLSLNNCKKKDNGGEGGGDEPEVLADASLNKVEVPGIAVNGQQVQIKGIIQNFGDAPITSMDISWKVDNGQDHTMNLTGLNIPKMGVYEFTHSTPYQAETGNHTIAVTVSNVNGKEHDKVDGNNLRNAQILVASQGVQRRVLYEEFTSSTCNPCARFNSNVFTTTFLQNNARKIAVVKYQMSWPGSGDPYYTDEGGVRRQYYGVNGVPTLFMDGQKDMKNSTSDLQRDLDNEYQIPAIVDLQAYYTIDANNTVKVKVVGTPYVSGNFTLHVAVVEKTTTGNATTNGETEFHNVMMKMVPNAQGTGVTATDGTAFTKRVQASLNGTHIEEMNDLEVVVFIQNDTDKSVLQSAIAIEDATQIDF